MLALLTVFEHLTNVRRLLNRFHFLYTSPAHSTVLISSAKVVEPTSTDSISTTTDPERDILLGPVLNNILSDDHLADFDEELHQDLQRQENLARELDACLLEMREIERDMFNLKQRQCHFYERYLDFIDRKDQLIDQFVDYYDEYLSSNSSQSLCPTAKQLRKRKAKYEFNIPVSNRFDLLK
ncbi:unnamed protein product [Adineta ricciae]|uniref:Uncharacterized protein n=1 Tax=Adineta ricciae TaxID=249248 RepID=A0A814GBM9_ADIRI|nr:unnamed protein product [Adineta ricciae]CAF0992976.1 unnamed protein product [Adineta ricciae]